MAIQHPSIDHLQKLPSAHLLATVSPSWGHLGSDSGDKYSLSTNGTARDLPGAKTASLNLCNTSGSNARLWTRVFFCNNGDNGRLINTCYVQLAVASWNCRYEKRCTDLRCGRDTRQAKSFDGKLCHRCGFWKMLASPFFCRVILWLDFPRGLRQTCCERRNDGIMSHQSRKQSCL